MRSLITRLMREEEGQDLIEYALLAGFISLAALVGIKAVGTALDTGYNNLASTVKTALP